MKTQKTLLVICAMGYATSTMIKKTISEYFAENGVTNWTVDTTSLNMSRDAVAKAGLIVSSLELNPSEYSVPVLNGVPLISGIGKDEALNQILEHVKKIDSQES